MKPKELQYTHKKQIGFTEQQHKAFIKLQSYNVNVNQLIRTAVAKELKLQWKNIKQKHDQVNPYF